MKKVLLINSSPRKNGNSSFMCGVANKFYVDKNFEVTTINLQNEKLDGCIACGFCKKNGKCFRQDNTTRLLEDILGYDLIIMFCPVYFCGFDSQTKKLIDRSECFYDVEAKTKGKIALVVSFGATLEENYLGMHYGMKYFAKSIKKQYIGVKAFGNTDNLDSNLLQIYKQEMLQFLQNIIL